MKKVLVIAGPTASGKSGFGIECARRFDGEIISGDSIQVYRGFDIGSGKIQKAEMQGVEHHLLSFLSPDEPYSVYDFQKQARAAIDDVSSRSHLPIIVGGTGLYLKACLYDYDFSSEGTDDLPPADPQLGEKTTEELYEMLRESDPVQAQIIHPHNRRRILRSLTIQKRTGQRQSDLVASQDHRMIYDAMIVGCTMERELLYARINARVHAMFEAGLKEEVDRLLAGGVDFSMPAMRGIGYQEFRGYYEGQMTLDEVEAKIQMDSRHYAKKQYTWLRHQMPVHWFNPLSEEDLRQTLEEIDRWKEKQDEVNA